MDPSILCAHDPQRSAELLTDDPNGVLLHGRETELELPNQAEHTTINISTEEKLANSDIFNCSACSVSFCLESSPKAAYRGPSEPGNEASSPLPELCNDFIPAPSSATEPDVEPETSPVYCLKNKIATTESDNLDIVEAPAPLSDLYIFESDTREFILTHTADPQLTCPEYQPKSQLGVGKADQERNAHVLMCYSDGIETRCQSGFREERATENNVSEASQREELRASAADAWEAGWESGKDVRPGTAEVMAMTLQRQHSHSPAELWLDACQYLTGEEAEDKEVLDRRPLSDPLKESDGDPSDSRSTGRSPVKRWSSVDSWASALSDWTGIIEDPPEDFTAAFAEIGAEINALTQALQEVTTHLEPERLQRDPRPTALGEKRRTMGVQDQPLKTPDNPERSSPSEQSCLSLCLEAPRPALCNRGGSQGVKSLRECKELEPEELQSSQEGSSPCFALPNVSAGLPSVREDPDSDLIEATLDAGTVSSGCVDLPQLDRYLMSFPQDAFSSDEDPPIELKITEDVDLSVQRELVLEQASGEDLCKLSNVCTFPPQGSVIEAQIDGNKGQTDFSINSNKNSNEPSVDTQSDPHVPFNTSSDLVGKSQVESGSPELIMCVAPLSGDSAFACRTSSGLEGDQTRAKTCLSDSTGCGHAGDCTSFPTLGGITGKRFPEGHEELIHSINTAEKFSPDETAWPFLSGEINDLSRDLARFAGFPGDRLFISENRRVACITLGSNDPFIPWISEPSFAVAKSEQLQLKMPHKTSKNPSDGKTRSKKEKAAGHHHGAQAPKKQESASNQKTWKQQENHPAAIESRVIENSEDGLEAKEAKLVMETVVGTGKTHGKKKKKHGHKATVKQEAGAAVDLEHGAQPKCAKGKAEMFEAKLGVKGGKSQRDVSQSAVAETKTQQPEDRSPQAALHLSDQKELTNDDVIKKRRVSGDKFGKILNALECKLSNADVSLKAKGEEAQTEITAAQKKAYSEVVKQKIPPKEDPKVLEPIQAVSVSGDPQSLCLWCQFAGVHSHYTVTWSRDGTPLAHTNRSAGDESRVSLIITNASHKDLGKYTCQLSCPHGSVYLDYVLTYEVLSEIVIPASPLIISSMPEELCSEEEDAHCSRLLFKDDFLSDQYFGENHPISILTEKVHFGEGMHRRAFRTKLKAGQIPLLVPGHSCVLKVHNAISYGTKNDDLLQKNFNLAVEECQVQNTAREYIKAYTSAARSVEAFGDVPEIIPIYLVHRPSNDIPYATLEEELIGDFVKYSVKDGKEINVMRRDSEAGQKCCAFQHWVYHNTEGNLLVTDMQGVGMKLTDVGIATCKKGYKGFKGNCATSFIDQFKALHQCNKFCEILGLKSLQPKPKKFSAAPKPKPPPPAVPKKKPFGPTVKNKS